MSRPFSDSVQQFIATEVLEATLPLMTALAASGVAFGLFSFAENPYRVVPGAVALAACAGAWWCFQRRAAAWAVRWMLAAMVSVPVFAMVFNGGLRAPAAVGLFVLISMMGWFYGRTAATWAAVFATAMAVLVGALTRFDVLRSPEPPPPVIHAGLFSLYVWLTWIATAYPQARLRQSFDEAAAREEALSKAELAFRAVFDRTIHPMMLVRPTGEVLRANPAAAAFADPAHWPKALKEPIDAARARTVRPDEPPLRFEVPPEFPHRRLEFTLTPYFDAAGKLGYWIVEGRDVTQLLENEERENRVRRMALIGQLAAGIAHDFNNALAAIVGSAEVLREELKELEAGPAATENLDAIVSSGMRASAFTRQLLVFGAQAPTPKRVQSLHALLTSTMGLLTRTLPTQITVRSELKAPRDQVEVDDASVESILLNLAINARDAMPDGGTLTVSTETTANGRIRVSVADTGVGIPPEVRPHIFEPYFTTKGRGLGTGVGLASVLGAMASHGGSVDLRSEVNAGTTFFLEFPLVA